MSEEVSEEGFFLAPVGMAGLFVSVILFGVALVSRFDEAGIRATDTPEDPAVSVMFVVLVLVLTLFILVAMRYGGEWVFKGFVLLSVGFLVYVVLSVLVSSVVAVVAGLAAASAIYLYPEWYVIDIVGVVVGAGGVGVFGASLGVIPALLLLLLLAVYDAVAVYRTKHMLDLAGGVMDLKLPVLFVVPTTWDYSFLEEEGDIEEEDKGALFMGLGDAVIPGLLAASAANFMDVPVQENLAVAGVVVGSMVGFGVLMYLVSKGKPHAGLPLLNGGAIAGFLVGLYLMEMSIMDFLLLLAV